MINLSLIHHYTTALMKMKGCHLLWWMQKISWNLPLKCILDCTLYSVLFTLYSVHFGVIAEDIMKFASQMLPWLYSVQCIVYNYTLYIVHCAHYSVHFGLNAEDIMKFASKMHPWLYSVQLYTVQCTVSSVHCTTWVITEDIITSTALKMSTWWMCAVYSL